MSATDYTTASPRTVALAAEEIAHPDGPPGRLTHATLVALFSLLLPAAASHLPLIYHTPRHSYIAIDRIVLSVTATPGIYRHLSPSTALFLHRPWDLDRRRLTQSTLVLASHQRLDELLTTGHNTPLLRRLGVEGDMRPIIGYKNDPDRKIGLVGRLPPTRLSSLSEWIQLIHHEFQGLESTITSSTSDQDSHTTPKYIACMNAFDPETIDRAIQAAASLPRHADDDSFNPAQLIYLTGQPRPLGVAHAETIGLPVLFTGHRRAEVWAIRFLANVVREGVPGVEVVVVDEEAEEEEMNRRKQEARARTGVRR